MKENVDSNLMMADLVDDIEPVLDGIAREIEDIRQIIRNNSYIPLNIKEARTRFVKKTSILNKRTKALMQQKKMQKKIPLIIKTQPLKVKKR